MSKYDKLKEHLSSRSDREWNASFDALEILLGFSLPESAYKYPAWWANQLGAGHIQSKAWQDAGWKVESLSIDKGHVTFRRLPTDSGITQKKPLASNEADVGSGLTIAEAKAALSVYYNIPAESIEITLRG